MISCGIVAEYNPFHNGHKYQIDNVRRELKPDVVIAVMSGNFLQRGEPALLDKWTRTKMALAGGVDLVVELPAVFAVQPADYFAKGAIQIMKQLDVDYMSYGVEKGSAADYLKGAKWMTAHEKKIGAHLRKHAAADVPYAKQIEDMIKQMAPDFPLHLNAPNNQLGFAYAKEIVRNGWEENIQLLPLERKAVHYNDERLPKKGDIASATAIRTALQEGQSVRSYIPECSYIHLEKNREQMVNWSHYYSFLAYQLLASSKDDLRKIYQMTEGLENRLKDAIVDRRDFTDFLKAIKTKRYTQTRLQRLLTYVLLQWKSETVMAALAAEPSIRILGFTQAGQAYLSKVKHSLKAPLIANVNQTTKKKLAFDIGAGQIYRLGKPESISEQDFKQKPIKFD